MKIPQAPGELLSIIIEIDVSEEDAGHRATTAI